METTPVFVHGLFHGLAHLRDLAPRTARQFLVLDLSGYGEHAVRDAPTSIDAQVAHVVSELDRHGVSRATLVGHSVGGAVAMLTAVSQPHRVDAVINVEGNFTLADAFWSSKVAGMTAHEAETMLSALRSDPVEWLVRQRINPSPERIAWTQRMFDAQPASTVHALAKAVVEATRKPDYLKTIEVAYELGIAVHLFAGERSRSARDVPDQFLRRATSFTTQPGVGHMMPIEEPGQFLRLVMALAR
jgi:pimeloyl-ACP methyl ester carboxylesterase